MAASVAVNAFGTLLKRNGTTIAEVTNIDLPELSRDTAEVTHHQSPNMWRERIKILKDAGEVSFSINYIPTNSTQNAGTGMLADFANDTTNDTWTLVFPDSAATTWTFAGAVTKFAAKAPIDDRLTADISLQVMGQPTLA
jgi:predicted secreted protein